MTGSSMFKKVYRKGPPLFVNVTPTPLQRTFITNTSLQVATQKNTRSLHRENTIGSLYCLSCFKLLLVHQHHLDTHCTFGSVMNSNSIVTHMREADWLTGRQRTTDESAEYCPEPRSEYIKHRIDTAVRISKDIKKIILQGICIF